MTYDYELYADVSLHRMMLLDKVRNEAFQRAIMAAVEPGSTVLDVGAGSGILSLFAARAGARKVYAVERTQISYLARQLAQHNGVDHQVDVIYDDLEKIRLPERVDVLISEWMGGFGMDENMLFLLAIARDKWLKEGGIIIPGRLTAYLAPVWDGDLADELDYWESRPHGLDLRAIGDLSIHGMYMNRHNVREGSLVAPAQAMWTNDPYTVSLEEAGEVHTANLSFVATGEPRQFSALATWFSAEMHGSPPLTNAPDAPDTHWGRYVFPLDRTVEVEAGTPIEVEFRCEPTGPGDCEFCWSVKIGDGETEHHDSRRGQA